VPGSAGFGFAARRERFKPPPSPPVVSKVARERSIVPPPPADATNDVGGCAAVVFL
jgi:hypothetical protein